MVIDHQDINVSNADELKFGHALNIRKGEDGWAWCDFTSDSDEAINLINEGWSVSCAYVPTKTADAGFYHNIPYDREILEAKALHIAIVQKPRYEKALVFENSLTINKNNMSNELLDSIKNAITAIPSAIAEGFRNAKKNESEDKEDDKKEEIGAQIFSFPDDQYQAHVVLAQLKRWGDYSQIGFSKYLKSYLRNCITNNNNKLVNSILSKDIYSVFNGPPILPPGSPPVNSSEQKSDLIDLLAAAPTSSDKEKILSKRIVHVTLDSAAFCWAAFNRMNIIYYSSSNEMIALILKN
jgi:hypothetical protein